MGISASWALGDQVAQADRSTLRDQAGSCLLTCCRIALPIALQGDLLGACGSRPVREGEQPQSGCVRGGGVGLRAREIGARDMKCSFNIQRQLTNTIVIEPAKLYW